MAGSANPSGGGASAGATGASVKPDERSSASATMLARTGIMRAVYGGTETMRAMEREFLPQYERESDERYNARLQSTFALNKLREAVDAASGKPFSTLIKVNNGDADLDLMVKDIDLMGTHLHHFAHKLFNNALLDGQCHFLVDHPTTLNLPNLAAQKAAGVRPFFRMVTTQNLYAAYNEYVGGDVQCVHARIGAQKIIRTPDFKEEIWNQVYVIEKDTKSTSGQGVVQVYEQKAGSSGGEWTRVSETRISLPEVPLVTLHAGDREGDYVSKSIFQDLAYKQIEHWISSSDQRSILAAARFPMLACSGVILDEEDDEGIAIGPYKVLYSPEAQGRWYFVEPTGKAIESGLRDLAMLEMHMDMMALNPVQATHRQYVPQNERDIQETRVHSVVHDLALACKSEIERGLRFAGLWGAAGATSAAPGKTGRYDAVTVDLNVDFANTQNKVKELALLLQAYEKRGISRDLFLAEAKRRDLIGDDTDIIAELNLMQQLDQVALDAEAVGKEGAAPQAPAPRTKTDPVTNPNDPFEGNNRPTREI